MSQPALLTYLRHLHCAEYLLHCSLHTDPLPPLLDFNPTTDRYEMSKFSQHRDKTHFFWFVFLKDANGISVTMCGAGPSAVKAK